MTYVALLRGINVGRHRRIAMAELRELVTSLGHADVVTHLQSGNVVFSSRRHDVSKLRGEIEAGIASRFGLEVRVLIRTRGELARIVETNPLPGAAADPTHFRVTFLDPRPTSDQVALVDPSEFRPDEFRFGDGVVYVWYRGGILESKLTDAVWIRRLGVTATSRNWSTVTRLAGSVPSLLAEAPPRVSAPSQARSRRGGPPVVPVAPGLPDQVAQL